MKPIITVKSFNGIGDLLFATPTFRRIKEVYPDSIIRVNTNFPALLYKNPFVDEVNTTGKEGVFLGYADPIHCKYPTKHHIIADWEIICEAHGIQTPAPKLKPEIHYNLTQPQNGKVGVQTIHKGHWHAKKVWPKFRELLRYPEFEEIPHVPNIEYLVKTINEYSAVVCAEGGISHIARALGIPAVVLYGGFASPKWNGYKEQVNICNEKHCSFCYNPKPCNNRIERLCMKEITLSQVFRAVEGVLKKIPELHKHNQMVYVKEEAVRWCRGKGLDIGAGNAPLPGAIPINEGLDEDAYYLLRLDNEFDFVFSSHCLEHLTRPVSALREWIRVLKPGGILFLYLPSPDYIPWRKASLPKWHKYDFRLPMIVDMLNALHMEVLELVEKDYFFGQTIIARKKERG
jgi:hypothetical protein